MVLFFFAVLEAKTKPFAEVLRSLAVNILYDRVAMQSL